MSKYFHCKVWGEIIYPFPNFSVATVEVWGWACEFLFILGFKSNHVRKRVRRGFRAHWVDIIDSRFAGWSAGIHLIGRNVDIANVTHWIFGCGSIICSNCEVWMENEQIKSPAPWTPFSRLSHRCDKSDSMLFKFTKTSPTKKINQE